MEFIFVDLQGFKHKKNEFVVKEISILKNDNQIFHYIVKPPYEWIYLPQKYKKQAIWLENNYHGFSWNDGFLTLAELKERIQPILLENEKQIVCVKGAEKIAWLKQILDNHYLNCINLENEGCDINLSKFEKQYMDKPHCKHHKLRCSFQNVLILKEWFESSLSMN